MGAAADKQFIERCLDAYDAWCQKRASDVPEEMRVGSEDEEGWCAWKMVPSTVSMQDVAELEAKLPCPLPPLFRAYLTTRFVLDMDFGRFSLPALPRDRPLREVTRSLLRSSTWPAGYLAFASSVDGDPVCMDFRRPTPDGDYPIVMFNHDLVPPKAWDDRALLEPYEAKVAPSFGAFFLALCERREIVVTKGPAELANEAGWKAVYELLKKRGLGRDVIPDALRAQGYAAVLEFLRRDLQR